MQLEDREREAAISREDATRNLKMKGKEVRGMFGLWDNVYDRRVIRALDVNSKWEPNRHDIRALEGR